VRVHLAPGSSAVGRQLGVEDDAALGEVELAEPLLGAAAAIRAGAVNLIVAVLLEYVQDFRTVLQLVDSDLLRPCTVSVSGMSRMRARHIGK